MQRGFVKLFRKSVDNPLFKKPLIWHYFEYCLIKANHSPKTVIWNKEEKIIERGSFITGRKQSSNDTGLSERNIRTAISTLENLSMIFRDPAKSTNKYTYLTVCNYELYNPFEKQNDQQTTSKRPANDQEEATTKNKQELITINEEDITILPFQHSEITEIINYLNSTCGTNYRETTEKTISLIKARLKEKYTVENFKTVILKKFDQWEGTESEMYLRPETLFGNKFENYLNQNIIKPPPPNDDGGGGGYTSLWDEYQNKKLLQN